MRIPCIGLALAFAWGGIADAQVHPRLLFRGKPPEFPWRDRLDDLKESPPGLALHWLYTGDEASARSAAAALRDLSGDEGYGLYALGPILYLPVAYDWLSPWRGWSAAERKAVEEKIARTAESCRAFLAGRDDHVFHTSAPRAAMGLVLAGAVLEGHDPRAGEWLAFGREYLEKTYLPALGLLDGAAVAGMSYGVTEGFFPFGVALWALKTAMGVDLFAKDKRVARVLDFTVSSLLPDHTFVRWGDIVGGSRASTRDEIRPVIDLFAAGCSSADGLAMSARIDRRWPGHGYHAAVLWLAPAFVRESREDALRLPTAALFGKESVGQAFFRSGWGEGDTVVHFKCGDYFDDHGHFDQGSFTIFRRGPLAVRSFAYGGFDAAHRMEFGRRSIAHSTLVFGADDVAGGQRLVRSMDVQDVADYASKKKSKDLETGDVTGWEVKPAFAWLSADLAAAYDPQVVRKATRELVWLDGRWLVVLDRVSAAAPARWLLHTVASPRVEGSIALVEGAASSLVCTTLLPAKPRLEVVEGWKSGGRDFPPDPTGEFHVPGGHRLEVSGGSVFVHVLAALDPGERPPRAKLVSEAGPVVEVAGKRLTFAPGKPPKVEGGR